MEIEKVDELKVLTNYSYKRLILILFTITNLKKETEYMIDKKH